MYCCRGIGGFGVAVMLTGVNIAYPLLQFSATRGFSCTSSPSSIISVHQSNSIRSTLTWVIHRHQTSTVTLHSRCFQVAKQSVRSYCLKACPHFGLVRGLDQ